MGLWAGRFLGPGSYRTPAVSCIPSPVSPQFASCLPYSVSCVPLLGSKSTTALMPDSGKSWKASWRKSKSHSISGLKNGVASPAKTVSAEASSRPSIMIYRCKSDSGAPRAANLCHHGSTPDRIGLATNAFRLSALRLLLRRRLP
jgi:hypothetical protein